MPAHIRVFPLLLALGACSGSQQSTGYLRSRVDSDSKAQCLSWSGRVYTYNIDAAGSAKTPGDTERAAVDAAFATWQKVADGCSDFLFVNGGGGGSNANHVVWRETTCESAAPANDACFADGTCPDKYGCWDQEATALALTTTTYSRSMATILDAEIQLNAAGWLFTTVDSPKCMMSAPKVDCVATDVQNTLTHEIGHAVGFEHVTVQSSTMFASAPLGETSKRVIDDGTKSGFCKVYPKAAVSPACE